MPDLVVYKKLALTGGGATALDGIDGADLVGNELAFVTLTNQIYHYILNATSGATDDGLTCIAPDVNPGNKRWILQHEQTVGPMVNLLSNSNWIAMSGSGLTQGVGSGRQTDFNVSNILTDADGSTFASWTGSSLTITDGGANLLLTATATAAASATYTLAGLTVGKLYKASIVTANGTHSWDNTNDTLSATSNADEAIAGASVVLNAGTNSFIWEATETNNKIKITVGAFTDTQTLNVTSIYVDEVTPGYVAADTMGPDGWYKDSILNIYRQHNDGGTLTKDGSFYSLKVVSGSAGNEFFSHVSINAKVDHYQKFAGRTVTFGAWVKSDGATILRIRDITAHDGPAHTGGNAWEWLEYTYTVSASPTGFQVVFLSAATETFYISQPMLVFGSSIGQGNYAPIPGEEILTQSNIALTGYTATTSAADGIINLEAASSGMIGKGPGSVIVKAYGKDSAAGDGVGFDVQSASGVEDGISVDTQVNNIRVQGNGPVKCDANGDIYFDHRGSGSSALTVDIKVIGIRP